MFGLCIISFDLKVLESGSAESYTKMQANNGFEEESFGQNEQILEKDNMQNEEIRHNGLNVAHYFNDVEIKCEDSVDKLHRKNTVETKTSFDDKEK